KSCAGGGSSASELRRIQCAAVEIVNDPGVVRACRILRNVPHANLDCTRASLAHKWMGPDRDALQISLSVGAKRFERIGFKRCKFMLVQCGEFTDAEARPHCFEREADRGAAYAVRGKFESRGLAAMCRILDCNARFPVVGDDRGDLRVRA